MREILQYIGLTAHNKKNHIFILVVVVAVAFVRYFPWVPCPAFLPQVKPSQAKFYCSGFISFVCLFVYLLLFHKEKEKKKHQTIKLKGTKMKAKGEEDLLLLLKHLYTLIELFYKRYKIVNTFSNVAISCSRKNETANIAQNFKSL